MKTMCALTLCPVSSIYSSQNDLTSVKWGSYCLWPNGQSRSCSPPQGPLSLRSVVEQSIEQVSGSDAQFQLRYTTSNIICTLLSSLQWQLPSIFFKKSLTTELKGLPPSITQGLAANISPRGVQEKSVIEPRRQNGLCLAFLSSKWMQQWARSCGFWPRQAHVCVGTVWWTGSVLGGSQRCHWLREKEQMTRRGVLTLYQGMSAFCISASEVWVKRLDPPALFVVSYTFILQCSGVPRLCQRRC